MLMHCLSRCKSTNKPGALLLDSSPVVWGGASIRGGLFVLTSDCAIPNHPVSQIHEIGMSVQICRESYHN